MRTHTITTSAGDMAQWLADPVDPAGWLTRPRVAGRSTAGRASAADLSEQDGVAGGPGAGTLPAMASAGAGSRRGRRPRRYATRSARRPLRSGRLVLREAEVDAERELSRLPESIESTDSAGWTGPVEVEPAGYRMGRWARLAITVTVLAAVVVLTVSLTAGTAPSRLVDITVGPGDTLWSIATVAAPDRDPRAVIDEIRELNDVPGTVLPVGVVLRVPVSAE